MNKHHNPLRKVCDPIVPVAELLSMAAGRWPGILIDAGIPADCLADRRGRPCPRCGGRDRFAALPDLAQRGAVMCRGCFGQGDDPRPGDGLATLRWWLGVDASEACRWLAGWLGVGAGDVPVVRRPIERRLAIPDHDDDRGDRFARLAERYRSSLRPAWLRRAAGLLGLPPESLALLGVGWADEHRATAWPMCDGDGRVIGVRLRCPRTAKKWAVTGSAAGLFVPGDIVQRATAGRLFVCEGPTDTAALVSIGLGVVGAPAAGQGGELLARLVRRIGAVEVIVVADGDGPGRAGAERITAALLPACPVRIVSPPEGVKDARAWVCGGADQTVILDACRKVAARHLAIGRAHR